MIIYKLTSPNGKIYIGQTIQTFHLRMNGHKKEANRKKNNTKIVNAIRKYGWDNFKKEIIVEGAFTREGLNELEKHYIQLYASYLSKVGYNTERGGNSNKICKKINHSGETINNYTLLNKIEDDKVTVRYKVVCICGTIFTKSVDKCKKSNCRVCTQLNKEVKVNKCICSVCGKEYIRKSKFTKSKPHALTCSRKCVGTITNKNYENTLKSKGIYGENISTIEIQKFHTKWYNAFNISQKIEKESNWAVCENFVKDTYNSYNKAKATFNQEVTLSKLNEDFVFSKTNFEWVTNKDLKNKTASKIEYDGKNLTLKDWAKLLNIKYETLKSRLYIRKLPVEKVLSDKFLQKNQYSKS